MISYWFILSLGVAIWMTVLAVRHSFAHEPGEGFTFEYFYTALCSVLAALNYRNALNYFFDTWSEMS